MGLKSKERIEVKATGRGGTAFVFGAARSRLAWAGVPETERKGFVAVAAER